MVCLLHELLGAGSLWSLPHIPLPGQTASHPGTESNNKQLFNFADEFSNQQKFILTFIFRTSLEITHPIFFFKHNINK